MNNKRITVKNMTDKEYFFGHKACAGCGGSLAVRLALKVFGDRTFAALPAGCMSAVGFIYPQMAFLNNAIISTFPGTGSMLSGMRAGLDALGIKDTHVVGFAGDGGTADIGLQALSGAIDREEKIIYICYDNEAYMNTGVQKSSLTPYGARTTTSPAGENLPGSVMHKKNLFEIVAAHDIAYAATASVGYPQDYLNKLSKAALVEGTSYIHIYATCPTGWGTPTETSVSLAKEAVDSGLWYLAEYENGEFTLNRRPKEFFPVKEHLLKQGRFKHLKDSDIRIIEEARDKKWKRMLEHWK
ncbi:MAG: pyruvate synthase subunit beta [Spirochaetes bacterium]|nr:MAG: pyruvate synthase subunit beta [Spirochaetota bacterium]